MEFSKFFNSSIKLNIILIISFSISVNSFTLFPNVNNAFYILFHLTFIYLIFYHYHYYLYIVALVYGILFDILLLNTIGAHLFCFILLISIYILLKKYLFLLNSIQVSSIFFVTLLIILYSEVLIAFLFNNIYFTFLEMFKYLFFSVILFIPSIFVLNKLDNWNVLL